ncbi:hypothetical protein VFPPC_10596 [Pochonia chlamydosporia 170]|uniref:DUF7924 domain-containing protein n=1 Tax=Pochonia chlamydosporia 170 TaxID=1380566 RepID=A0A179F431_METCM|nr:hypothetical protein VFPPC_10596 [Pochonia chlamydosporia 170]OAQ60166.1 hypothetical protein VFPPC_10596 [Pochonia chlamydosporia 170]
MPRLNSSVPSPVSMAVGDQNRKRHITDEISKNNHRAKKRKIAPNFSPAFYDELSEVPLALDTLRELDRRNRARTTTIQKDGVLSFVTTDISRFSRLGGPGRLQHLRQLIGQTRDTMENSRSSSSGSRQTQSTRATSVSSRGGSSRYGKEFDRHLLDYGIYMNNRKSKPANVRDIQRNLEHSRASLSPSQLSEETFEAFQRKNEDAVFESDVVANVIPVICGNCDIPSKQNALFTELEPLTNSNAVRPKPDLFDGANFEDLHDEARTDPEIKKTNIPTKHATIPVSPNFFLEVKGPDGNASVAQRQACYDGAYGARAMHALQSYRTAERAYDQNAYTLSSTYHDGQLKLFAHHVTGPTTIGGRPQYHMTPLKSFSMTNTRETFIEGATAFRNARSLAKTYRDAFIQATNIRTRPGTPNPQGNEENWKDADDALQGHIADACKSTSTDGKESNEALQSPQTDDGSPNPSQASTVLGKEDPSLSFATSFTSSFTSDKPSSGPKRARQLSSPNNSWGLRSSKSRTRVPVNQLLMGRSASGLQSPDGSGDQELETESQTIIPSKPKER